MTPGESKSTSAEETASAIETSLSRLNKRLDMLEGRLDNMDSIISAVVERVMKQTLTVEIVCPHCGHHLQATIVGAVKMKS